MMTVYRNANHKDLGSIVRMGEHFHSQSVYSRLIPLNKETIQATAMALMSTSSNCILVAEIDKGIVGMLGLATYEHPVSGLLTATELFWWVEPAHRGRVGLKLLRMAEDWALQVGADRLQMIAPNSDIEKLYQRMSYDRVEVSYQKVIR